MSSRQPGATYLKLGGSLITDKRVAETPRPEVILRLAREIAAARANAPELRLIVGHGSGSFGHVFGQRYGTRDGARTPEQWYGFAATGDAAARLNRIVTAALLDAGVPAWSIQPGAVLRCVDGRIVAGPEWAVQRALDSGLAPVVFGDVALDDIRGATITGTEEIFEWLMRFVPPQRIILAGEVEGIFTADPLVDLHASRVPTITPANLQQIAHGLTGSHGVDVTGGMAAKVAQALAMVEAHPAAEVAICSGLEPGVVLDALLDRLGDRGTRITAT
jgi:isopentenyl phosphate kinase